MHLKLCEGQCGRNLVFHSMLKFLVYSWPFSFCSVARLLFIFPTLDFNFELSNEIRKKQKFRVEDMKN